MSNGFFVPNSISGNYVSNKKTSTGAIQYDTAQSEIGLSKQAALQSINKQYSPTIDKAYSGYLAANRNIQGSQMGQGYKSAYIKASTENLQSNVANAKLTAANARADINASAGKATSALGDTFASEVYNMDRVKTTMEGYLSYVKNVSGISDPTKTFLTDAQRNQEVDTLYDTLFDASGQLTDYYDSRGEQAKGYAEWVKSEMGDNVADREWSQWLFGSGGLQQFRKAVTKGIKS
jgi:hypothetical protein